MNENTKQLAGKKFPCPLCREDLGIRLDKNDKPYCVCDPCGIQLFIRKEKGINTLFEMTEKWRLFKV